MQATHTNHAARQFTLLRLLWSVITIVGVSALCLGHTRAEDPDPMGLIRGVESSREGLGAFTLVMTAQFKSHEVERTSSMTVVFSGDHRRYSIEKDGGTTITIFDGVDAMHFRKGSAGATIDNAAGAPPDYIFDPRTLGLTGVYAPTHDIRRCLGYEDCHEIVNLGAEVVNGFDTWKVRVHDRFDQIHQFWIEESAPFRVHRYEYSLNSRSRITASTFNLDMHPVLPVQVSTTVSRSGSVSNTRTVMIDSVTAESAIPADTFSLAGLEMPVGTPVTDIRLHERIGYWRGDGLTERAPIIWSESEAASLEPPKRLEDTESRSSLTWLIWANVFAIVCIAAILLIWKGRSRN